MGMKHEIQGMEYRVWVCIPGHGQNVGYKAWIQGTEHGQRTVFGSWIWAWLLTWTWDTVVEHKYGLQGMGMSGSASMDMSMGLRARVWDRAWTGHGAYRAWGTEQRMAHTYVDRPRGWIWALGYKYEQDMSVGYDDEAQAWGAGHGVQGTCMGWVAKTLHHKHPPHPSLQS